MGNSIGVYFIIFGLSIVVFTIVDLSLGVSSTNSSSWQENSIWPTIGKGIWVGIIVSNCSAYIDMIHIYEIFKKISIVKKLIATGIVGIIAVGERTQVSVSNFPENLTEYEPNISYTKLIKFSCTCSMPSPGIQHCFLFIWRFHAYCTFNHIL